MNKNGKIIKFPQNHTSNTKRTKKNKWKIKLFNNINQLIIAILSTVLGTLIVTYIIYAVKHFSFNPPSLNIYDNSVHSTDVFYYAKVSENADINYLAFQTGQTGYISFNLTNNDESTLVVNNIYLDVIEYKPITDIILLDARWGGGYSDPVYYGVQLGNLCKKYKCIMLDRESAGEFLDSHNLSTATNFKIMGEQIECNNTDEIRIIFSPLYPGIYQFKIIVDYSIRNFNKNIESDCFEFISVDTDSISQN